MKKTWIKKENIYHKPFYKQKFKMTLVGVILMAIIFFAYQIFYIKQLQIEIEHVRHAKSQQQADQFEASSSFSVVVPSDTQKSHDKRVLRGIRFKDYDLYNPLVRKEFVCIASGKAIPIERLNDDYCDCVEDGSDEPETNACANGVFYCTFQKRHITGRGRDISVPSSRVNDRICDCCDGSDEWHTGKDGRPLVNCTNTCS